MTAAVGVAVGLGSLGVALLSTLFTVVILSFVNRLERRAEESRAAKDEEPTKSSK
jgi:uncharacterized membrane protein YhiD involved in acid resistance